MSSVQALHGRSVKLGPFFEAVRGRAETTEAKNIMSAPSKGTPGKVYLGWEDYGTPEGDSQEPWGREIIKPGETMWPSREIDSAYRGVNFLVVTEMNAFLGQGYNPADDLERLQQIAYEQLQDYAPDLSAFDLLVRRAIYRERGPQAMPEYDQDRELWWLSSEFRTEVTRT